MTRDAFAPVDFALKPDSLQLVLQDQFVRLADVLDAWRLGQQVVLRAMGRKQRTERATIIREGEELGIQHH